MKKLASSNAAQQALSRHEARGKRFDFLRERLSHINIPDLWETLEAGLSMGAGRKNPERVYSALDSVDSNGRKAGMIAYAAQEELDEFKIHYRAAYSEWSGHARETLELRKKEKRLSGQITLDQVENWIARNMEDYLKWNDAKRALVRNLTLAKQMADAWQSRAASLRKQADMMKGRRELDPSMLPRRGREGEEDDGT